MRSLFRPSRCPRYAMAPRSSGGNASTGAPLPQHPARRRTSETCQNAQKARLAGSVWPDEQRQLTRFEFEIQRLEQTTIAAPDRHVLRAKHRILVRQTRGPALNARADCDRQPKYCKLTNRLFSLNNN